MFFLGWVPNPYHQGSGEEEIKYGLGTHTAPAGLAEKYGIHFVKSMGTHTAPAGLAELMVPYCSPLLESVYVAALLATSVLIGSYWPFWIFLELVSFIAARNEQQSTEPPLLTLVGNVIMSEQFYIIILLSDYI